MKKNANMFRNILRIAGTIAAILYTLFLVGEGVSLTKGANFADISVYMLFLVFLLSYYFLWKNEFISGIIIIAWHLIQWVLVFWVWIDGGLTLVLGLPIGIFGIIVLIYGIKKTKSSIKD